MLSLDRKLKSRKYRRTRIVSFSAIGIIGTIYVLTKLVFRSARPTHPSTIFPYLLLDAALLLIALGFEFVNGSPRRSQRRRQRHLHPLARPPRGRHLVRLLELHRRPHQLRRRRVRHHLAASPSRLILKVSLWLRLLDGLRAARLRHSGWNLLTWARGLPRHPVRTPCSPGSILGVGIANQLMHPHSITSGIDWSQVTKIAKALFFSPVVGFTGAFLLLWIMKRVITDPELYQAPENDQPPPAFWIRCLLICTCTGISFAHGSNDGQKGMGLIMLILVGTVPTAYALNHTVGPDQLFDFVAVSQQVSDTLGHYIPPTATLPGPAGMNSSTTPIASAAELQHFISTRKYSSDTTLALRDMVDKIQAEAQFSGSLGNVPPTEQTNVRNQMYLVSETLVLLPKFRPRQRHASRQSRRSPSSKTTATSSTVPLRYIPHLGQGRFVALALGFGTMFGWRRIVVTVGEKIGSKHLTYGQGACSGPRLPCSPSSAPPASACRSRPPTSSAPASPAR